MKSFGREKQFFNILFCPLFVNYINLLHNSRIKDSKSTSNVLFADSSIRPYDIETSKRCVPYFSPGLNHIPITNMRIANIAFDSKKVVATYFHRIVFL